MKRTWFRRLLFGCALAVPALVPASHANAGPIIDWLKGKPQTTAAPGCVGPGCATTAYYPWSTYYPAFGYQAGYTPTYPVAQTGYQNSTVYPVANYPVVAAYNPAFAQQAYAQPAYTVASPYRQVVGYRGTAGSPITLYQNPTMSPPAMVAQPGVVAQPGFVGQPAVVGQPMSPYYSMPQTCANCPRPAPVGYYNYAPQVSYRTAWMPVAVTYYRPVTGIDPATGRATTIVQPCIVNTWQQQRVPTVFQSHYFPTTPMVVAPQAANCYGGACYGNNCPTPTGQPYYAPSTTFPSTGPATTPLPATTYPPGTTYPSNPAAVTPADVPPSLRSNPNLSPGGLNYPPASSAPTTGSTTLQYPTSNYPATSNYPPSGYPSSGYASPSATPPASGYTNPGYSSPSTGTSNSGTTTYGAPNFNGPSYSSPSNSSSSYSSPNTGSSSMHSVPQNTSPSYSSGTTNNGTSTSSSGGMNGYGSSPATTTENRPLYEGPPNTGSNSSNFGGTDSTLGAPSASGASSSSSKYEMPFKPVPDPEATSGTENSTDDNGVPQLINPRDKSASLPARFPMVFAPAKRSSSAISSMPASTATSPSTTVPTLSMPAPRQLDERGWISVK